jgi:hypothetical protein
MKTSRDPEQMGLNQRLLFYPRKRVRNSSGGGYTDLRRAYLQVKYQGKIPTEQETNT